MTLKEVVLKADVQVWVCVNDRENDSRLPSCTRTRGERVLERLRAELAPVLRGKSLSAWMNRTLCQGFCHQDGVTVSVEIACGKGTNLKFQGITEDDVAKLCARVESVLAMAAR